MYRHRDINIGTIRFIDNLSSLERKWQKDSKIR